MALVDLRRHESDGRLTELLEAARAEMVIDASSVILGWDEDGQLVGCLGIARPDKRALQVTTVFVAPAFRRQTIGRRLIEALTIGAPVERLVVECDQRSAQFFESCGFGATDAIESEAISHLERFLPATAAKPEAIEAVTLESLEAAIRAAWGPDTSADPDEWTADCPARGQCDATAVVVRSYLGGDILVAFVLRDGRRVEGHAWNRLPSGLMIDLTREQFRNGEQLTPPVAHEPLPLGDAAFRHELLAQRVRAAVLALGSRPTVAT